MTENIPAPLTPPDCDLRGMEWMPFFGNRLFTSDFEARASDAEFRAATRLWWMSWNQVPAASLPDDDQVLCNLAGLGRDLKAWKKLRQGHALHGFLKCSDGRLYHSILAQQAIKAYENKTKFKLKRDADRLRLDEWRSSKQKKTGNVAGFETHKSPDGNAIETRFETQKSQNGNAFQGRFETPIIPYQTNKKERKKEESIPYPTDTAPADADALPDVKKILWSEGLEILVRLTGHSQSAARTFLGKLLRELGQDVPGALAVLRAAADERPAEPGAWIMKCAIARKNGLGENAQVSMRQAAIAEAQAALDSLQKTHNDVKITIDGEGHLTNAPAFYRP